MFTALTYQDNSFFESKTSELAGTEIQLYLAVKANLSTLSKLDLNDIKFKDLFNNQLLSVHIETKLKHATDLINRCKVFALDAISLAIDGDSYEIQSDLPAVAHSYSLGKFQFDGVGDISVATTLHCINVSLTECSEMMATLDKESLDSLSLSLSRYIGLMSEIGIYLEAVGEL